MTPLFNFRFTMETLHALDCAALSCSWLSAHKHLHWSSLAPPGPQRTALDPPLLAHQSPVCTAAGPAARQSPLKLSTQAKNRDILNISLVEEISVRHLYWSKEAAKWIMNQKCGHSMNFNLFSFIVIMTIDNANFHRRHPKHVWATLLKICRKE